MIQRRFTIFRKLTILMFGLLAALGILFITITYFAVNYYHQASTQRLNKEVAAHIATYTSPFTGAGLNKEKADSVFQSAMVLSPAAEVYFLDNTGKVIYFHASKNDIKEWNISTKPIEEYIATKGEQYITGVDPKDPDHNKIFSAADVSNGKEMLGYIYVILDSEKSESIMGLLMGGHILSLTLKSFIIILLLSFIFSFLYLKRIGKNFQQMIAVLERFEKGEYAARFNLQSQDEMLPVTSAFNKMADLLVENINKLTRSEDERKNFIAAISHDLRTPLSIARGYTETLLLKKQPITEQEDYAKLIYTKILQIENMVKQLFELSKIDAVEFKPQMEPFVFSEIVQEAVNTHQLIAAERKLTMNCTGCSSMIWIKADVSMIERVIQNLVDNALKNTPENGSVNISVEAGPDTVKFTIENNGTALNQSILHWIASTGNAEMLSSGRPQKAGLGLVIVQKILFLHHTKLVAETKDDLTSFSFNLPNYSPLN